MMESDANYAGFVGESGVNVDRRALPASDAGERRSMWSASG